MLFLTKEEQNIIQIIHSDKRISLSELVRKTGGNKSSIHYQIRGLVDKGIILQEKISSRSIFYSLANPEALKKIIEKHSQELTNVLLKIPKTSNNKPKLVFCDWYMLPEEMLKKLEGKYEIVTYPGTPSHISQEAFILRCQNADVVVTFFSVDITRAMLEKCKQLKILVTASISVENIDLDACKDFGISIHSLDPQQNYKKGARTEFIFVSLFSLLKPIYKAAESLRIGKFDYQGFNFQELRGKSIGIVGIKREGKEIIPILRLFGCTVLISNPDSIPVEPADLGVTEFLPIKDLFEQCEVVIFPEDYDNVIHINTSLMNPNMKAEYFLFHSYTLKLDLDNIRALILSRKIKSIAIDYIAEIFNIFDDFLTSDYRKVMNFPNVIITPELGFYTEQSMQRNYQQVFEILNNITL